MPFSPRSICIILLALLSLTTVWAQQGELPWLKNRHDLPLNRKEVDSLIKVADSLNLKANLPGSSLPLIQLAITSSKQIQYQSVMAKTLEVRGMSHLLLAEYPQAIRYFDEAITLAEKGNGNKMYPAFLYSLKSIAYFYLKYFDSAASSSYKAIDIAEQYDTARNRTAITVYNNLSIFWMNMHNEKNALHYQQKVENWALQSKDTAQLIKTYTVRGFIYSRFNEKSDSAIYYFQSAIDLSPFVPDSYAAVDAYHGIGTVYFKKGAYAQALRYFQKAYAMPKTIGATSAQVSLLYMMGQSYFQLRDYVMAKQALLKGIELVKASGEQLIISDLYKTLSFLYDSTGDERAAYHYLKLAVATTDTISIQETQRIINELEIKYQSAQKDKVLTQRQLDIQQQKTKLKERTFWFASISIAFLLLAVLSTVLYRNSKHRQKIQENRINNLLQQQQIEQLKARMDGENKERKRIAQELHDGVCNMISAARMQLDNSLAEEYNGFCENTEHHKGLKLLDDAYEELRRTSHNLFPEKLLNNGLVEALKHYCNSMSKPPVLRVHFQLLGNPQPIVPDAALSIYRIVQESVHNAIKHGQADDIIIQLIFEPSDEISITIEDNGTGLINEGGHNNGIGMYSLRQRIISLGGSMDIQSQQGVGTSVNITFHNVYAREARGNTV